MLEHLAAPTNLDSVNISSSGFFLLINGMANIIAAQILEIEYAQRYNPNEPFPKELLLKIAINWLGIQAALDPNVVGDEIADFLREKRTTVYHFWSQISKYLSLIPQNTEGVTITTEQLRKDLTADEPTNQQFTLTFNPNSTTSVTIVLSPPNLQEPKKLLLLIKRLWLKLKGKIKNKIKKLKIRFF